MHGRMSIFVFKKTWWYILGENAAQSIEVNYSINVSHSSYSLPSLHDLTHETVATRESNTAEDSRWCLRHFGQSQRSIFVACGVAPRWQARTHLLVPYRKYDRGTDHLYGTTLLLLFSPCNWETLREGRSERRDCVISRFQEHLFLLKGSSLQQVWGQTSSRKMSTCWCSWTTTSSRHLFVICELYLAIFHDS